MLVIEHHLDVIKNADWVIDLGPEGGRQGGMIVAEGTLEEIALNPQSYTGQYLRRVLVEETTAPAWPAAPREALRAAPNGTPV